MADFQEVYNTFLKLKEIALDKKEAIVKKDMEKLYKSDEECSIICEKIKKFNLEKGDNSFNNEEKENLKKLGQEIKIIQENNEILINHSLNVINNTLSGILHVIEPENSSYNSKGVSYGSNESLNISSVIKEA